VETVEKQLKSLVQPTSESQIQTLASIIQSQQSIQQMISIKIKRQPLSSIFRAYKTHTA
jgi:hypothetical protein